MEDVLVAQALPMPAHARRLDHRRGTARYGPWSQRSGRSRHRSRGM